ncbi:hypothetical protein [Streptococcus halichoeri]|nr:hypothetical protein [Streptococcus halichoeri]
MKKHDTHKSGNHVSLLPNRAFFAERRLLKPFEPKPACQPW